MEKLGRKKENQTHEETEASDGKLFARGDSNLNCDPGSHCSQLSSWYRETVLGLSITAYYFLWTIS